VTYKSPRQALDAWTLDELLGHLVSYRKLVSPSPDALLPVEDFRLYAVCTRIPRKLARTFALERIQKGVYEVQWGGQRIRIIVLSQVPKIKRNALWQLFSGVAEKVKYGAAHYRWRQKNHSRLINKLYQRYRVEAIAMPYTWDDFDRDFNQEVLEQLTPEERLKGLPAEARLKGVPIEARLKGVPIKARLKGVPIEAFLKRLPAAEIEAYLKKFQKKKRKSR